MRVVRFDGTFTGWQAAAREALRADMPPHQVIWSFEQDSERLFELFGEGKEGSSGQEGGWKVPRAFIELGKVAALHADKARWSLLYRVLWRLTHGEGKLMHIVTDADVIALRTLAKAVQKDAYRMQQYVRFRETRLEGETWFVAWYEPEHDSLGLVEKFFTDRFTNMRWSILTPARCMHWDGLAVTYSEGVGKAATEIKDDAEGLWVTYYSSIFNPARVKVRAMKSQMPVRNWRNLPEARAIAPLLSEAPLRVARMIEASETKQTCPEELRREGEDRGRM